jgi:hypothetical protein
MGNIFLHSMQSVASVGERMVRTNAAVWKNCGISAFLRVAKEPGWAQAKDVMTSRFSGRFNKGHSCPSSQGLLAYHRAGLPDYQLHRVEGHLTACDFCNAELQLLSRHPSDFEESTLDEMPEQLRILAEQLLNYGVA